MTDRAGRRWAPLGLAAIFTGSGILHLLRPDLFLPLIPRGLPAPALAVAVSGIAELACAAGLVTRRSWAGPASAALLVASFPATSSSPLTRRRRRRPIRAWSPWPGCGCPCNCRSSGPPSKAGGSTDERHGLPGQRAGSGSSAGVQRSRSAVRMS